MRIALYGKGGIGKSTIAANLSAALADSGRSVLQIGCDPKHDSTRLLLQGQRITTVLDYVRTTSPEQQQLDDVLHVGYGGVVCVEAGGPEPGVGCAGRGILSTFALLKQLGLDTAHFDIVLYDVLGDVVCGGFAVPLRTGYADVVCIVTSEEFMALYAANNILRGVQHFDGSGTRLAGIVLNSRGEQEHQDTVQRFAKAVQLPIVETFPRSDLFRQAEAQGRTVVEAFPNTAIAAHFRVLAYNLLSNRQLLPARPLGEEHLEQLIECVAPITLSVAPASSQTPAESCTGNEEKSAAPASSQTPAGCRCYIPLPTDSCTEGGEAGRNAPTIPTNKRNVTMPAGGASYVATFARGGAPASRFLSKNMLFREPLHGCAFSGIVSTTTQIHNAITIAHGPRSCTHMAAQTILSSGMHTLQRQGIAIAEHLLPNLLGTDMSEDASIYGGSACLHETLQQAMQRSPQAIFIATTCPAGIIGDDIQQDIQRIAGTNPAVPIIPITSDGNMAGDYMQGVINACIEGAAALIDPHCTAQDNLVNVVAEKNIATNTEPNLATIADLLSHLGLRIHCRFVRRTTTDALRGLLKAPLNLLAYNDHLGRVLQHFLVEHFNLTFAERPFPVGFTETQQWLYEVARFFARDHQAETMTEQMHQQYQHHMRLLRRHMEGKRLMIVTYSHDIDWIVEAALDAGIDIVKVGILNYVEDYGFRTRYTQHFDVETGYSAEKRDADMQQLKPHLLLSTYTPAHAVLPFHVDTIPLCPDVGFFSGLRLVQRWSTLLKAPIQEGWRHDRSLFFN